MSDLISRQAAIDALYDWGEHSMTDAEEWHIRQVIGDIKSMPSAQPERKQGRWVHDGYDHPHGVDWMHCSECGRRDAYVPAAKTNYCPDCGAKMEPGKVPEPYKEEKGDS